MPWKPFLLANIIFIAAGALGGCTSTTVNPGTQEYTETIVKDQDVLQGDNEAPKRLELSIDEALNIAVRENLDARVAAFEYLSSRKEVTLENLKALPSMRYVLTRSGRNNLPASSSLSVLTGQQSLEPSVSQEKYRNTRDITVNWSIIDAASALMQGQIASDRAKISEERYRKVVQNISRDVYSAYWNALAGEKAGARSDVLIDDANAHIVKLDLAAKNKLISVPESNQRKTPFLQSIASIKTLQADADLAKIELRSLLNIPQSTELVLTSAPSDPVRSARRILDQDMSALELVALQNRPEIREAFINKNISIKRTKQEIISTIPGSEVFYALNQDTNRFLVNNSWKTYSINLVQNITSLISFPDRYLAARKNEDLSEVRRITMAAAIMAQVHISRHGLIASQENYQTVEQEKNIAEQLADTTSKRQKLGRSSVSDALLAQIQAQEKRYEYYKTLADFQEALAIFSNTLGQQVGEPIVVTPLSNMGAS